MSRSKKPRRGDRSFQPSAAGKGDGDRTTDVDAYRANYDAIDWSAPADIVWAKQILDWPPAAPIVQR